jgi:hypothetical protein
MTRLTLQTQNDDTRIKLCSGIQKSKRLHEYSRHDFSYTNFSGNYGNPMAKQQMPDHMCKMEAV